MIPHYYQTVSLTKVAITAGLSYGLWKIISRIVRIYTSPLHYLRGPKSNNMILGSFTELTTNLNIFNEWAEKYGKVYKTKGSLGADVLVVVDSRAINYVLTHSVDFPKPSEGRAISNRLFGEEGILFADEIKHKNQRRIMNPSFSPTSIKQLVPIFLEKSIQLRDILKARYSGSHQEFDVLPWFNRTTLDVIGLAGFDYHFNSLNIDDELSPLSKALSTLLNNDGSLSLFQILRDAFPTLAYLPTERRRVEKQATDIMTNIAEELVQKRKDAVLGTGKLEQGKESSRDIGHDLLSALVAANLDAEVPDSQRMSHKEIIAQIPTFFFAGHETSSTQMTWALYFLCANPGIQEKLYEELIRVPTDTPSADELAGLPYLDSFVRETLRLRSVAPVTVRIANRDNSIPVSEPYIDRYGRTHSEIRIKRNEVVIIPIHAVNCSKQIWGEDASEFNPDRWLNLPEAANDIPGVWGSMMTFLGGSRSCIGFRFALFEMKALLFTLIRSFSFELTVPADRIECRLLSAAKPHIKGDDKSGSQLPVIIKCRNPDPKA